MTYGTRFLIRSALLSCLFLSSSFAEMQSERIRIGVILPLSGAFAEYGEATRNGISLAQREHPELFARTEFVYEDDRYEPKQAVAAFQKLKELDKVHAVIVWGNESALALAPVAETQQVPLFVYSQNAAVSRGRPHVVRMLNPAREYSAKMADFLRAKKYVKPGIVKTELSFFNILVAALLEGLSPAVRPEIAAVVLPGDLDLKTVVTKIRSKKFDALGVYLTPPQVVHFYQQAAAQELRVFTFGTTPFESKTVIEQARGLMDGAVYVHNNVSEVFQRQYLKAYGTDVQLSYAALAYDGAVILASAGKKMNDIPISGKAFLHRVASAGEQKGASGAYGFRHSEDEGQYFEFEVVIKRISGNSAATLNDY